MKLGLGETGFSSISFEASPKRGAGPGLHWGGRDTLSVSSLHHVQSCVLIPFKHRNISPLKDTFKNAHAFKVSSSVGQWCWSTRAVFEECALAFPMQGLVS